MILAENRTPHARIVVGANPTERHAAAELQEYVRRISGAELPIVREGSENGNLILIGEKAGLSPDETRELGYDGFVIRAAGNRVLLAGALPVSALYAAYGFLERYLGCGFFEDGDQIPRTETVSVGNIDRTYRPRFRDRVYHNCMQYAYSGMMWWDEERMIRWVDFMAKKRINIWEPTRLLGGAGVLALALERMGYGIHPTAYQTERFGVMKKAVERARLAGMRVMADIIQYNQGAEGNINEPGAYPFSDRAQLEEFMRQYRMKTGDEIPCYRYVWCNEPLPLADPRHPEVRRLVRGLAEVYNRIFDTGSLYFLPMMSEGSFGGEYSVEETGDIVKSMVNLLVEDVKRADPGAEIVVSPPFAYCKTYRYQVDVVKQNRLKVGFDWWLNMPGRLQGFLMEDYFYGNEWISGMVSHCGKHSNPWGDARAALENGKKLAHDPKAGRCVGFCVSNEINHRNIMINDLFLAIGWNPDEVEFDAFVGDYARRRYGKRMGAVLEKPCRAVADTLLSSYNMDATNHPLYREIPGGYLPGLTAVSVKRTIGWLPELFGALGEMAGAAAEMEDSDLFRFDAVDLGRTYLGALFNLYLAGARLGGYRGDADMAAKYGEKVLAVMDYIARFTGAHEQFRLQTYYDWAGKWPPVLPERADANARSVFITFTNLISQTNPTICDYMAEDMNELVGQYFRPRIEAYLNNILRLLGEGKTLSGDLRYEGSDQPVPNRCDDFAPPRGALRWSAFGPVREPELTGDDPAIRGSVIAGPSLKARSDFYDGPICELLNELLRLYPLPGDISSLLAMDPAGKSGDELEKDPIETLEIGQRISGITKGIQVEKYVISGEAGYLFETQRVSSGYNLLRGDISLWLIRADDFLELTRIADGTSIDGLNPVKRYSFELLGREYVALLDPGSAGAPSSFEVLTVSETAG